MLIVFLLSNGDPVMEKKTFEAKEECMAAAQARNDELENKDLEVVLAGCITAPAEKVSK